MGKRILEALIFAELDAPACEKKRGDEYYSTLRQANAIGDQLRNQLTQEQWKIFLSFEEKLNDLSGMSADAEYIRGFRTGAQLMLEILLEWPDKKAWTPEMARG